MRLPTCIWRSIFASALSAATAAALTGSAQAKNLHTNCSLVSGGLPGQKLAVQIDIDTSLQTIRETYSNPDGPLDVSTGTATLTVEYKNGQKVGDDGALIDAVDVTGDTFTWSRKGKLRFTFPGAPTTPSDFGTDYERTFLLDPRSGDYKEHLAIGSAATGASNLNYQCTAAVEQIPNPYADALQNKDALSNLAKVGPGYGGAHKYFNDDIAGRLLDRLAHGSEDEARALRPEVCAKWREVAPTVPITGNVSIGGVEFDLNKLCNGKGEE